MVVSEKSFHSITFSSKLQENVVLVCTCLLQTCKDCRCVCVCVCPELRYA